MNRKLAETVMQTKSQNDRSNIIKSNYFESDKSVRETKVLNKHFQRDIHMVIVFSNNYELFTSENSFCTLVISFEAVYKCTLL